MNSIIDIIHSIENKSNSERREIIKKHLQSLGVHYYSDVYPTGENIIVPTDHKPYIGIGNHFDAVEGSPGANDNGSSVAVTLDLIRRFETAPLKNIGIQYFFFDEEEVDLVGSAAYVAKHGYDGMQGLYNMEMVGRGKHIALWEVEKTQKTPLLNQIEKQAKKMGINVYRFPKILNAADHMSFQNNGMADSFTITTISDEDLAFAQAYEKARLEGKPESVLHPIMYNAPIFKDYHRPTDTSKHLHESTLQMVSDVLYNSVMESDKTIFNRRRQN
jgi:Zn-dependent M28 family amino/carboxypeptidase